MFNIDEIRSTVSVMSSSLKTTDQGAAIASEEKFIREFETDLRKLRIRVNLISDRFDHAEALALIDRLEYEIDVFANQREITRIIHIGQAL